MIVVYTAIFGGYDILQPSLLWPGVCLTEGTVQAARNWKIRVVEGHCDDPRRNARRCKVLAHEYFPDVEYTIWHDGSIELLIDPLEAIEWLGKYDLAVFPHPKRNCIYDEAEACIAQGKDDPERIRAQVARYEAEGFPHGIGLVETKVLIRRNTQQVRNFCELWWEELSNHSFRDQLSFDYVRWKTGIEYNPIPIPLRKAPHWFREHRHNR